MKRHKLTRRAFLAASAGFGVYGSARALAHAPSTQPGASARSTKDQLPSWNDGEVKSSITDFVVRVTTEGAPDHVPLQQRIAVFDNDGTLWAERPVYFQLQFAIDRIEALAPQHPEWGEKQPFKAVLEGDREALAAAGVQRQRTPA